MPGPIPKTFGAQHLASTRTSIDSPRLCAVPEPHLGDPVWSKTLAGNVLTIKEAENFAELPAPRSDPTVANVASRSLKTTGILKWISVAWLKIGSPVIIQILHDFTLIQRSQLFKKKYLPIYHIYFSVWKKWLPTFLLCTSSPVTKILQLWLV